MKKSSTVLLLVLAACTGPAVQQEQTSSAATAGPRIRRPDSLAVLIAAGNPTSQPTQQQLEAMQRRLDTNRAAFRYAPSTAPKPDPGRPLTRSFLEDDWTLHERFRAAFPNNYSPSCVQEPCVLRADLDGDGQPEGIVSAWDRVSKTHRIAVAGRVLRPELLDPARSGLNIDGATWRVVPATEVRWTNFKYSGVLFRASNSLSYLLFHDGAANRIVRL